MKIIERFFPHPKPDAAAIQRMFPTRPRYEALKPHELPDPKVQLHRFIEEFHYHSPAFGQVTIPVGFTTDFASIPGLVKWWLDDDDSRILCPSLVHDRRYDEKTGTRLSADIELMFNMIVCGARPTMAFAVFLSVRIGGGSHWK